MDKTYRIEYFNRQAKESDAWKKRNRYYHRQLRQIIKFIVPPGKKVIEIGCGTGDLISYVSPSRGVGIDFSNEMLNIAKSKYNNIEFINNDAENLSIAEKFDYVILSDMIGYVDDVWQAFRELKKVVDCNSRVVITYYNYLWDPVLWIAEILGLKMKQDHQNWLSQDDICNLLYLNGFEAVKKGESLLIPVYIPLISGFINKYVARLPLIRNFCLIEYIVARYTGNDSGRQEKEMSCSIIMPCRNEAGNIESAVSRTPQLCAHTELIFVDGNSTDGTIEKIREMIDKYKGVKDIKLVHQGEPKGKADAVQKGFKIAAGDIFFILDSDLTVPPEDLLKFYIALMENKGELINGSRFVYPMEKESMRFLNKIANKLFSMIFSKLLEQRITDTLCGTKILTKDNYNKIVANRSFFGDFDPFGDFDLLFGAAKLNLKIVDVPIRYKPRTYGDIKIERFKHGWLLFRMVLVALRKLWFK